MRIVTLNSEKINNAAQFHELLRLELGLPEWYGCNLDALWDVLDGFVGLPLLIRLSGMPLVQKPELNPELTPEHNKEHNKEHSQANTEIIAIIQLLQEAAANIDGFDFELV
ncbi:barstar family protein [Paenibacillus eucommiae]|uniref:Ribonuclease inhibitor n=1 Tax=Paenibacillus eucommiae TaxID=1355755 RepID=A0ABS4J2Z1_9BACL|nr:barstar family protein [Paenibacillus eucommiae]MBP1994202.1 ribonuclease inhibitor [Paenibacillus eucommiae]